MKKIITVFFVMALIVSSFTMSFANTANINERSTQVTKSYIENGILITEYEELPTSFREYKKSESASFLLRSASTGWKDYDLLDSGWYKKDKSLGWHKQFPREKRVDSYWFSNSKSVSMGISIGGDYLSFGVSAESSPSSGYSINADSSIWTRPKVYGDIKQYEYNVKEYNGAGVLIDEYETTIYSVYRTYIVAEPYGN